MDDREIQPVRWTGDTVQLIDQTRLPLEYRLLELRDYRQVVEAIRALRVRGAPAIGVAGACAVALGPGRSWLRRLIQGRQQQARPFSAAWRRLRKSSRRPAPRR